MSDTHVEIQSGPAVRTKFAPDDGVIEGYLARYGEVDAQGEVFEPGAFRKSLVDIAAAGVRVPLLWAHRQGEPIGSWLELRETSEGLYGMARINTSVERGREALALIRSGDLSGLSVGFIPQPGGRKGNLITEARLMECSLVALSAAQKARVVLRQLGDLGQFTDFLRASGVSRREAELVARKAWPAISGDEEQAAFQKFEQSIETRTARLRALLRS